jgi:hypothetical protein
MANGDFLFDLGKGRRLRGHGPLGLLALTLLLAASLAAIWLLGKAAVGISAGFGLSRLISALGKRFQFSV